MKCVINEYELIAFKIKQLRAIALLDLEKSFLLLDLEHFFSSMTIVHHQILLQKVSHSFIMDLEEIKHWLIFVPPTKHQMKVDWISCLFIFQNYPWVPVRCTSWIGRQFKVRFYILVIRYKKNYWNILQRKIFILNKVMWQNNQMLHRYNFNSNCK